MRSHHPAHRMRSLGAMLAVLTLCCSMFAYGTSRAPEASAAPGDGSISGVVLDSNAQPIPDVSVTANSDVDSGIATTDASGAFSIPSLGDGSYTVSFTTNDGLYVDQTYDGVSASGTPTLVVIANGNASTGIDAVMLRTGSIAGTVTTAGAVPAEGVTVITHDPDGNEVMATTGADGNYLLNSLPPGDYVVEFEPNDGVSNPQWWDGASNSTGATSVTVTEGNAVSNINALLISGGSISGTIYDSAAQPVVGVTVTAETGGDFYYAYSAADGTYQFQGLPAGSYRLQFTPDGNLLQQQYWNGKTDYASADLIDVSDGTAVTDISPVLQEVGTISGTVTDSGGDPIAGINVTASGQISGYGTGVTAADGTYTIPGLIADTYAVEFTSDTGYLSEYYDNVADYSSAHALPVGVGEQISGIDASLDLGGTISGHVTDSGGNPLSGIYVYATGASTGYAQAMTDASGDYQLVGLSTDTYQVQFVDDSSTYAPSYYDGAVEYDGATTISLVAGSATTGIDASLVDAATVSGTVTGPDDQPVANASVSLVSIATGNYFSGASTDVDGTYSMVGLPVGVYRVQFDSPDPNMLGGYWNGATTEDAATPLTLTAGQVVTGIDEKLSDAPASISGLVTQGSYPLLDTCAVLWNGPTQLRTECTDFSGRFRMSDVAPGTYTLSYQDMRGILPTMWFGGSATQVGSTPITVVDMQHFDAPIDLSPSEHSIAGSVNFEYGDPSTTACVYLYNPGAAGTFAGQGTCTGAAHTYLLSDVPSGDYVLAFVDPMGLKPTVWFSATDYRGVSTQGAASTITLDGTTTSVSDVDVRMQPTSGSIIGQVTDATGTVPLANICLYAYAWDTGTNSLAASTSAATCTNSQGGYVLSGLPVAGSSRYQVAMVDPSGGYPTMWASAYSSPYSPSVSTIAEARPTTAGMFLLGAYPWGFANFDAAPGGSISGTVYNQATGLPRAGACVYVDFAADGTYVGLGAQTDALGHYTLPNLAPGLDGMGYKVGFYPDCSPGQPPTTHWNGGASSEAAASSVTVFAGSNSGGVDATF